MDSDAALLMRYRSRRCADSFRELVRRYAPMALAVARRVTGDADLAQDVAQESFFELSRHASGAEGSLAAWMHRVVLSRAIDQRRKIRTRREKEQAAVKGRTAQAGQDALEGATWSEVAGLVDEALARLPEQDRTPLILHYIQGQPQAEIAAALGVDQSTISRRITRSLGALRDELQALGVTSEEGAVLAALAPGVVSPQHLALLMQATGKMTMAAAGAHAAAAVRTAMLAKAGVVITAGLFTVVVVVMVIMTLVMLGRARSTARRTVCATNLRAMGMVVAVCASQDNDRIPDSVPFDGTWMCDLPPDASDTLLKTLTTVVHPPPGTDLRKTFYCLENTAQDPVKLWTPVGNHRVMGYVWMNDRAAPDGKLPPLDSVLRAGPALEYHGRFINTPNPSASELALDWIISDTSPANAATKWTGISRAPASPAYNSSHMDRAAPAGANMVCFDGHVEWRKFDAATGTPVQQGGGGTAPYFWFPRP